MEKHTGISTTAVLAASPSRGTITIGDIEIRQDSEGRYCLNDIHRAAGGEKRHQPANFLRLDTTVALIEEIEHSSDLRSAINTINGGSAPGTYVCRELVYAYAMWIGPAFNLRVIRTFDAVVTGQISQAEAPELQMARGLFAAAALIEQHQATILELGPKAAALDRIATAAEGSVCITNAAKDLQMRPKDLFTQLSANRWIYRRPGGSGWVAYQDKLQSGLLEHKITTVERPDGSEKLTEQVLVTAKGMAKLGTLLHVSGGAQ